MGLARPIVQSFNKGKISPLALARTDIKRVESSAEEQTNFIPRTMGSMMLRPGTEHLGSSKSNNQARHLDFVFATDDKALIELTDLFMRVWVNDALITRPSVSSAVANGSFTSNLTSWTDNDEAGATSAWLTGGYMSLTGVGQNAAIRDQTVTVAGANQNVEHALSIEVTRGVVLLRVGSTTGAQDYISERQLLPGFHSIAFTPTGDFSIRFMSRTAYASLVSSCNIEAAGAMAVPTSIATADLDNVRHTPSGDVIFLAIDGQKQRRIERQNSRSWSFVDYVANDGPFRVQNVSSITLTPSATSGDITLTASSSLFKSTQVGALFSLSSIGQDVSRAITAQNQFSDTIQVIGVGASRTFTRVIAGVWVGTVTLQRSIESPNNWADYANDTGNISGTITDGLDNQIVYYRIGIKTGNYTSGTANVSLSYSAGSITGTARISAYTSDTVVSAYVLKSLGGTQSTENWSEGLWSDFRGYPSAVALHEGRIWFAGKDRFQGSASDTFDSFDSTIEGDSGPISRSIGQGPVDTISWIMSAQRLLMGAQGSEFTAISSSFDELLTPTNFKLKEVSTQGSGSVSPVKVDGSAIFVQRGGFRIYEMAYDGATYSYSAVDLTALVPEIGSPGVVRTGVQRQPDTRVHFVRSDGTVAIMIFDKVENVNCFIDFETEGEVEDVVVLPGDEEDQVYYSIKRTINGSTVRYLEKWALESECRGGVINKVADCFKHYNDAALSATTVLTGLSHIEGEEAVVWGDGHDFSPTVDGVQTTFTVTGGQITLPTAVSTAATVGLAYQGTWKGVKLAYGSQVGTALNQRKKIASVGFVLADTHYQGLEFGPDFTTMDQLPLVEGGVATDDDTVWTAYDSDAIEFPGDFETDPRLCLRATAPRPATILAATINLVTHEKV